MNVANDEQEYIESREEQAELRVHSLAAPHSVSGLAI